MVSTMLGAQNRFDMYRIESSRKIAEHWDPALKTEAMKRFDPNISTSLK
jgi:predicted SnoaL-like aldol condensation-catalyzing enzyme